MRELNGRNETRGASAAIAAATAVSGWDKPKKKKEKRPAVVVAARPLGSPTIKPAKRSRLPAAAVKEMRLVVSSHTTAAMRPARSIVY